MEWKLKPLLLRDRVLTFLKELREAGERIARGYFKLVHWQQVAPASHQLWHVRGAVDSAAVSHFSSRLSGYGLKF